MTGNGVFTDPTAGQNDGVYAISGNGAGSGAINITTGAVSSTNGNGIEALTGSGDVTILTKGAVSGDTAAGFFGIVADAGDINITTGGPTSGGTGISATANDPIGSSVTINSTAGLVTGSAGDGIDATTVNGFINLTTGAVSGTGNGINAETGTPGGIGATPTSNGAITIVTGGNVDGGVGGVGILAQQNLATATSSGNISITTGGEVTAGTGIAALAQTGANITIDSSAAQVTGNGTGGMFGSGFGDGVFAQTVNGAISITTGAVTSFDAGGIEAETGTGINSTTNGAITIVTKGEVSAPDFGILALQNNFSLPGNSGNISITTGGSVFADGPAIAAGAAVGGNININSTAAPVQSFDATGIAAASVNGSISITTGAVTGDEGFGFEPPIPTLAGGISAFTDTGAITIAAHGPVFADDDLGIAAFQDGEFFGTSGNIQITTSGPNGTATVTGTTGIAAIASNVASISIKSTGGLVTGFDGDGVFAQTVDGAISITTAAVSGTGNGIEADTGTTGFTGKEIPTLNGAITIVTEGAVSGGAGNATATQYGILADQELIGAPSGNVSITTGGTVITGTGIAAIAQEGANLTINSSAGAVTGNGTFTGALGAGDGIFAQSVERCDRHHHWGGDQRRRQRHRGAVDRRHDHDHHARPGIGQCDDRVWHSDRRRRHHHHHRQHDDRRDRHQRPRQRSGRQLRHHQHHSRDGMGTTPRRKRRKAASATASLPRPSTARSASPPGRCRALPTTASRRRPE